jgi:hypothetical protein
VAGHYRLKIGFLEKLCDWSAMVRSEVLENHARMFADTIDALGARRDEATEGTGGR